MFRIKNTFAAITVAALTLAAASVSFAKTHSDPAFANIRIKNFGKMDDRLFRGAQPNEGDYKDLAALGVKTVIDLRQDPVNYEKRDVEALGMRYVNIPMSDSSYPKQESIDAFLKLVNDPNTGVLYVHCAGGRHRTGVMGAVYRFNVNHWTYDQAYNEMVDYDFYTRWGHGDLKTFVEDYAQKMQSNSAATAATASSQKN
ncbi:MAG TPA: tyrosine-protein phosphatase [Pyrinomonadaceae bacterium]|jgi:protein tyrosine/serine phosphatase|nr:tyrosine-protein phosphatase [Pyrinomonadaceae bacterium]